MNIKILTPELVVFEGEVESILLPGELGEFHILNDHAPVVSSLRSGKVKLIIKNKKPLGSSPNGFYIF